MKHAFATTSVLALLMAGPALAQDPATNSANPAASADNPTGATAQASGTSSSTGADIIVKQPPPVITVQPHAPNITVTPGKPDVAVQQAPPNVEVTNPTPNVAVETGKPAVKVLPSGKPDVAVQTPAGNGQATTEPAGTLATQRNDNATAGSGSTTPPAAGTPTVAPTAGVFPLAADVKNLIGKDVYGANGNKIGEVNNLLVGANDRVHAAVVEFGGFLGVGENKIAIPWEQLDVGKDRLTVNMTQDQIKSAPRWDKNRPGQFAEYQPLNK